MTNFIECAKDPLFRREVYEYLIGCVKLRLKKVHDGTRLKFGYICFNLEDKYPHLLKEQGIRPAGTDLGYQCELHVMLPELARPAQDVFWISWWGDDKEGNTARLKTLQRALKKVNKIISTQNN